MPSVTSTIGSSMSPTVDDSDTGVNNQNQIGIVAPTAEILQM